jgi:hypothetical protein
MRKKDFGALIPLAAIFIVIFVTWLGVFGPVGLIGDQERHGIAKWLYDWQQLLSGILALIAAGIAAWLVWRQLADIRKQAVAAERQAWIATDDLLTRRIAAINELRGKHITLTRLIHAVRLDEQLEQVILGGRLRSTIAEIDRRVEMIEHSTHAGVLHAAALGAASSLSLAGIHFRNVLEQLVTAYDRPNNILDPQGQVDRQLEIRTNLASAKMARNRFQNAFFKAAEAIAQELAPLEQRKAELRAMLFN